MRTADPSQVFTEIHEPNSWGSAISNRTVLDFLRRQIPKFRYAIITSDLGRHARRAWPLPGRSLGDARTPHPGPLDVSYRRSP